MRIPETMTLRPWNTHRSLRLQWGASPRANGARMRSDDGADKKHRPTGLEKPMEGGAGETEMPGGSLR